MNVIEMCNQAALLSERADEFVKEGDEGEEAFADDALNYYNIFLAAINEAYYRASKILMKPTAFATVTPVKRQIDLSALDPPAYQIRALLNQTKTANIAYNFVSRDLIEIFVDSPVVVFYHHMPDRLDDEEDEPEFPEAQVDPMVYIALACARVYEAEQKIDRANYWMQQHYGQLSTVKNIMGGSLRRVGRRIFR